MIVVAVGALLLVAVLAFLEYQAFTSASYDAAGGCGLVVVPPREYRGDEMIMMTSDAKCPTPALHAWWLRRLGAAQWDHIRDSGLDPTLRLPPGRLDPGTYDVAVHVRALGAPPNAEIVSMSRLIIVRR